MVCIRNKLVGTGDRDEETIQISSPTLYINNIPNIANIK
jgi:hypothetical protein